MMIMMHHDDELRFNGASVHARGSGVGVGGNFLYMT